MQKLRLFVPLPIVIAVMAAVLLLVLQPWDQEEAAGGTMQYRICDVVIEAPKALATGDVRVTPLIEWGVPPSLEVEVLGELDTIISIDPSDITAAEIEAIEGSADERLQPVLDTLRIEPLDPATAPWPYTDAVQKQPIHQDHGIFRYRPPDPGSGLGITTTYVDMIDGSVANVLGVANCRSVMERMVVLRKGVESEVTDPKKDVHPDDEAAFQTFFDEVKVQEP
jgi:hypothetical protein